MRKQPKTANGLIKAIEREVNKYDVAVRKIWRCKAGWGINYYLPYPMRDFREAKTNDGVTYAYYDTLEQCLKGEYRRVVEKKTEKGGEPTWLIRERNKKAEMSIAAKAFADEPKKKERIKFANKRPFPFLFDHPM